MESEIRSKRLIVARRETYQKVKKEAKRVIARSVKYCGWHAESCYDLRKADSIVTVVKHSFSEEKHYKRAMKQCFVMDRSRCLRHGTVNSRVCYRELQC